MQHHLSHVLRESGTDPSQLAKLFAPDVTFHSPILTKPVSGSELVMKLLSQMFLLMHPSYTIEVGNNEKTVLIWDGVVQGYAMQGATVLTENEQGLIRDVIILMRPYPVVTLFQQAMSHQISSLLSADHWTLPANPVRELPGPDASTEQPDPLELADEVTFLSPILVKPVVGKEHVAPVLKKAREVYGTRYYSASFRTAEPKRVINLWDGTVDGYTIHAISINTFNAEGYVTNITVLMRPYPVVELFRQSMLQRLPPFITPDYLDLPPQIT